MKVSESSCIFLVLCVADILLTSNDTNLLTDTKHFLFGHFGMKDHSEASYLLGIQILRDGTNSVLRLFQKTYTNRVLKRFNM